MTRSLSYTVAMSTQLTRRELGLAGLGAATVAGGSLRRRDGNFLYGRA